MRNFDVYDCIRNVEIREFFRKKIKHMGTDSAYHTCLFFDATKTRMVILSVAAGRRDGETSGS